MSSMYQLAVRSRNGKLFTIRFHPDDTVDAIKAKIQVIDGVPPRLQYLTIRGKLLESGKTVADYKIL